MSDVMRAFRVTVREGSVRYRGIYWTSDGNALFIRFRVRYPRGSVDVTELPGMRWDD